jgi:hypothetical protein
MNYMLQINGTLTTTRPLEMTLDLSVLSLVLRGLTSFLIEARLRDLLPFPVFLSFERSAVARCSVGMSRSHTYVVICNTL